MEKPKTIEELRQDFEVIEKSFNLDEKESKLLQLEARTTDPNLWDNQQEAKSLMQQFGDLKKEIDEFKQISSDLDTISQMTDSETVGLEKEIRKLQEKINHFKIKSFLNSPYDVKNALVSIHAGQGGTEAMDWTSMLLRMYTRYCEKQGWKHEIIHISEGEEAGIKSVTFKVEGNYAYGYLKNEAGTHRLVRQSPFNADNLRQTSFALVEVLPEFADIDLPEIKVNDEDLDWQFFRASSQGGQNVQKVSTAVRLKHKPTGIVVTAQTQRFQEQNRKFAMELLRAKLWALEQKKREEKIEDVKGDYKPASWGNQIRSYVLHPYKMVKDLRTDYEESNPDSILDGSLDGFIQAELEL